MEWDRRLARVERTGEIGPGSGYVVAPRLVLTSAHVVGQQGAVARVFQPGREGLFAGHVVWRGTPGGRDDAALVVIDDPKWRPADGATVRWGRTATYRANQRCEFCGVPDVLQRAGDPAVELMQKTGTFNPGTGMVNDRYFIDLDGFHPPLTRMAALPGVGCPEPQCSGKTRWTMTTNC